MATRMPFFLAGAQAVKVLVTFLFVQHGGLNAWKCVSCTQKILHLDCSASFHREDLFAGWLRPLALMFKILIWFVRVVGERGSSWGRFLLVMELDEVAKVLLTML